MNTNKLFTKHTLAAALIAAGMTAAPLIATASALDVIMPAAQAAQGEGAGGQGGHMGEGGKGEGGQGKGGAGGINWDRFITEDEDGDEAKGPKYMGGGKEGEQGGRPVWAQEGLLTDDLGRLSLARAPQHVLDRQLVEALASYDPETMEAFYELSTSKAVEALTTDYDSVVRLDSPAQNLALLQALLDTDPAVSPLPGVDPKNVWTLAAVFLGTAADKEMEITPEVTASVLYILLGKDYVNDTYSWDFIEAVADKADQIREAILTGHDE